MPNRESLEAIGIVLCAACRTEEEKRAMYRSGWFSEYCPTCDRQTDHCAFDEEELKRIAEKRL